MSYSISDASYFDPGPVAYPDEPFEPVPGWGMRPNMAGPRRVGVGAFSVTLGVAPGIASEVRNALTFATTAAAKAVYPAFAVFSARATAPAGKVALILKSSTLAKPVFVLSADPKAIAAMARSGGTHAIVLGPAAVIAAANAVNSVVLPSEKPREKPRLQPGGGFPVDVGGGGSGFPTDTGGSGNAMDAGPILADVQPPAIAAAPAWVVPVVVGFSALALIALAYSFKKAGAA